MTSIPFDEEETWIEDEEDEECECLYLKIGKINKGFEVNKSLCVSVVKFGDCSNE